MSKALDELRRSIEPPLKARTLLGNEIKVERRRFLDIQSTHRVVSVQGETLTRGRKEVARIITISLEPING